jgi:glycosyltransferase involved in cell wall biosynthesis
MKILYLCADWGIPVLGRKGASVHVREMAGALARAGHQVVIAAPLLNKSPWERPAVLDVPILQIGLTPGSQATVQALVEFNARFGVANALPGEVRRILYNGELLPELLQRLEGNPPDFIYERVAPYTTAGVQLAHALRTPHIAEWNAPLAVEQSHYRAGNFAGMIAEAERWTLRRTDVALVVSSALREYALSLGVAPERIHILPNAVNPALFHPASANTAPRGGFKSDAGPVIGFVGGLRPWHGVEVLPELLLRLAKRFPEIQLVLAGDGPQRAQLEGDFVTHGLEKRVTITGLLPHEEVPSVIRWFDVAVAPYHKIEHSFYFSPLKLFEYMACGVAVVAPRLGQIAEIIEDRRNGLLYPAGDLDALAAGCEQLLNDTELRRRLGDTAAAHIRNQFTWDHNARRVIELARNLLTARAANTARL